MAYKKILSLKDLNENYLAKGYKILEIQSKFWACKGHEKVYIVAAVKQEAPELFGGQPILSDKLLPGHVNDDETAKLEALNPVPIVEQPKPEYPQNSDHSRTAPTTHNLPTKTPETAPEPAKTKEIAQIAVRQPEPGNYIAPSELVLHNTPRLIMQAIGFQEGLHTIEKEKRHELAFARIELDAKGKPVLIDDAPSTKGGKETLFSFADLTIYRLAEIYTKWKKLEPDVVAMREKIIALSVANDWMACEIENLRNEKNMLMQSAFLVSLQRRR